MNAADAIKQSLAFSDMVWKGYASDLTEEEMLDRAVPGINHIAWQLGHLITSEHKMINGVCPGSMPELPGGFAEKHTKETSGSDDAGAFLSKDEYLKIADEQRQAALAALDGLSAEDFDKPGPEGMEQIAPTVGATFSLLGSHYLMHAGQWAVLRRKHGRPPLF
jgi:hypothetical protein